MEGTVSQVLECVHRGSVGDKDHCTKVTKEKTEITFVERLAHKKGR